MHHILYLRGIQVNSYSILVIFITNCKNTSELKKHTKQQQQQYERALDRISINRGTVMDGLC